MHPFFGLFETPPRDQLERFLVFMFPRQYLTHCARVEGLGKRPATRLPPMPTLMVPVALSSNGCPPHARIATVSPPCVMFAEAFAMNLDVGPLPFELARPGEAPLTRRDDIMSSNVGHNSDEGVPTML